jgi:hypothetical protein
MDWFEIDETTIMWRAIDKGNRYCGRTGSEQRLPFPSVRATRHIAPAKTGRPLL